MEISVNKDSINDLLREAKKQFINVSISNDSGRWSKEYYHLHQITRFKQGNEKVTIVLLCSPKDSECTAIDSRLIHGIKFDKYLYLNGDLNHEIKIVSKDTALQLSH